MTDKHTVELLESGNAVVLDNEDIYYMDCYRRVIRLEQEDSIELDEFLRLTDLYEIVDVLEPGEWHE